MMRLLPWPGSRKKSAQLPLYISDRGHGEASFAAPLRITNVTAYGFALKARRHKLQAFIDQQLNAASDGELRYSAVEVPCDRDASFMFHCYNDARHCTPEPEIIGHMPDREAAFLIPVWQHRRGSLLPQLRVWIPYLFIDVSEGLVTGREVWGYRKSFAKIELPTGPANASYLSCEPILFKKFAPDTAGQWGKIIQVRGTSRNGQVQPVWTEYQHMARELIERIGLDSGLAKVADELFNLYLSKHPLPVINLKQFRDAVDSSRACYQALVSSPCEIIDWKGGHFLDGDYEIEIATCDSHQIVNDLGLADQVGPDSTLIKPLYGFWCDMGFRTLAGSIEWQAT
ncbi:hypothetical protein [Nevskia soli]|uniref:hypothetical protein n=1 Tax=Nevskia soli TaxID=418856 RepID=UPI0004A7041C|nr:hypothetical protein [Nevskia soli]